MVDSYGILAQVAPASGAGALTTIYTVPSTSAVISSIVVCNTLGTAQSWNLYAAKGGAANAVPQTLFQYSPLTGYQTEAITLGITLATGDQITGFSSASGAIAVNLFGDQIT